MRCRSLVFGFCFWSFAVAFGEDQSANANPSFEQWEGAIAHGWTSDDIEGARWEPMDQIEARTGTTAMRLRGVESRSSARVRLMSDPIAVQAGDAVEFTAWTRATGTPRHNLMLYVEGERLGAWQRIEPVVDRPQSERWLRDQWVPQGYTVFVPAGVQQVRLVCAGDINSEIRVSWFVDDFSCRIVSFADYLATRSSAGVERLEDIYLATPDTLSQNVLGCYGGNTFTPNIDRLAEEGRLYEQVTSVAPWTKPSFASIMTSLYPSQHKVQDVHYALPLEASTLAELLKARGYFTAAFVWSAYDGYLGPYMQYDQGFDIYFYSDDEDLVTQALLDFLGTNHRNLSNMEQGGIFIWHHIWEPHTPYTNRTPSILANPGGLLGPIDITFEAYRRIIWNSQGYANAADLEYLHDVYRWEAVYSDTLLGEVFARFQWAGLLDRLNVLFASDHGESFGEKPHVWGHTHGYETCIRTPFIMRFPQRVTPGAHDKKTLVSNLDIMPTLLDLAGAPIPAWCEGRSLIGADANSGHTAQFGISETRRHGWLTIRDKQHKLVLRNASRPTDASRLEHFWSFCDDGVYELYDLQQDPYELNDISAQQPEVFNRLKAVLDAHIQRTGIVCNEAPVGEVREISQETLQQLEAQGYLDAAPMEDTAITEEKVGTERGFGNLRGL
jgi:arylsulfatase